jgi:Cdc6-like AAA superfamily ATPase
MASERVGAEKLNTAFKLERFRNFVGSRPFVIVLDEVDQARRLERDALVYNLCGVGKVGLVMISNSADAFLTLDDRIKSRLNAMTLEFECYSPGRLMGILRQRVELALAAGTADAAVLTKVTALSEGDARMAFKILKQAAQNAEADGSAAIGMDHVISAHTSAREIRKDALLARLSSHHKLLYDLVRQEGRSQFRRPVGGLFGRIIAPWPAGHRPAHVLRVHEQAHRAGARPVGPGAGQGEG